MKTFWVTILIMKAFVIKQLCLLTSWSLQFTAADILSLRSLRDTTTPSDEESYWVKLSDEESVSALRENKKICNKPYQHCCLGQGRMSSRKLPKKRDALWKWNEKRQGAKHLSNFRDLLDYIGETRQEYPDLPCNIMFLGDSLSGDTTMASMCQLMMLGYTPLPCHELEQYFGNFTKHSDRMTTYGYDRHAHCPSLGTRGVYINKKAKTCKTVAINYSGFDDPKQNIIHRVANHPLMKNRLVAVYNWGVHCNDYNTSCLLENAKNILIPLLNDPQFKHWTFLFREHEPQHFKAKGGLYQGDKICAKIDGSADNWRNEEFVRILASYNLTKEVPIVPIFDALVPLFQLHVNGADCTHYAYDPYRFDVTWDGMLQALKTYDEQHVGLPLESFE